MNENIHMIYAAWVFIPPTIGIVGGVMIVAGFEVWGFVQGIADGIKMRKREREGYVSKGFVSPHDSNPHSSTRR